MSTLLKNGRKSFAILFVWMISVISAAPSVVPSLKNWTDGSGEFTLTATSRIVVNGADYATLMADANTFREDLISISAKTLTIVNGGTPAMGDFFFKLGSADSSIGNEGYVLTVADYVTIAAKTTTGVFYGMQSVLQILKQYNTGNNNIPKGSCRDWPDYPMRALMVDPARKFLSLSFMENWIRRLAWYKMNYFHIHFTDNQGFRLQCDIYPGLASPEYYKLTDIKRFEALAAKYHVMIIPEIDMPGHASPMIGYDSKLQFKDSNLSGVLDITSTYTRNWLNTLLQYYLPLFSGPYFHIGTDETPAPYDPSWPDNVLTSCPTLVAYQNSKGYAQPMDCFVEFINWANDIVRAHGKTTRIWHWFDWAPNGIYPDTNIEIDLWEPAVERPLTQWDGFAARDPAWYASKGYNKLLNSSEIWNYYVPACASRTWIPLMDNYYPSGSITKFHTGTIPKASCTGGKMQLWGDNAYGSFSESAINVNLIQYTGCMGEVTWGGPRSNTLALFYSRQATIGEPPVLGTLTGAIFQDAAGRKVSPAQGLFVESVPFNKDISIRITGKLKAESAILIFDCLGRKVADLTHQFHDNRAIWSVSGHSPGIYVVILRNQEQELRQKIVLGG